MASPRGYQPFCPVGAALNAVGDRWALLVVRDLMLGPRRFSELLEGLGGVSTDILTARLRQLEEAGVVCRTGRGRAQRYELTDSGTALRPVLIELSRWGAERLRFPEDLSDIPPRVPLTALLLGASTLPAAANGTFEIRVGEEAVIVEVGHGELAVVPDAQPATTIELTVAGLRGLVAGLRLSRIAATGDVAIHGDRQAGRALLDTLTGPDLLSGLRRRHPRN